MIPERVLLLSLARARERRKDSVHRLREEGVSFEIVDAVDGLDTISLPQRHPGTLSRPKVGCYMSHLKAYERILIYGWSHGIILEDDFAIVKPGGLANCLDGIPNGWDYLRLHQFRYGEEGPESIRIVERFDRFNRLSPCGVCTHAQVVSRRFAEYMLKFEALAEKPIDIAVREISKRADFAFYEVNYPLVVVTGSPSYIN